MHPSHVNHTTVANIDLLKFGHRQVIPLLVHLIAVSKGVIAFQNVLQTTFREMSNGWIVVWSLWNLTSAWQHYCHGDDRISEWDVNLNSKAHVFDTSGYLVVTCFIPCEWMPRLFSLTTESLLVPWGPFHRHELSLISARISIHMSNKIWDTITHPLRNSTINGVCELRNHFIPHFVMDAITKLMVPGSRYFC